MERIHSDSSSFNVFVYRWKRKHKLSFYFHQTKNSPLLLPVLSLPHFFKKNYLFLIETEHNWGRGRERRRHRIQSGLRLQAPSCQHRARHGARTHKPRDHDLSQSQTLILMNHPSAHLLTSLLTTAQDQMVYYQLCYTISKLVSGNFRRVL